MKTLLTILIIILALPNESFSQDNKFQITEYHDSLRCNINILGKLYDTMDNPESKDILNFLFTFDESCNNHIEYSQFSNELLFELLVEHTESLIVLLSNENINIDLILKELSTPINDKFKIEYLLKKVENIDICIIKNKVKEALLEIP